MFFLVVNAKILLAICEFASVKSEAFGHELYLGISMKINIQTNCYFHTMEMVSSDQELTRTYYGFSDANMDSPNYFLLHRSWLVWTCK